MSNGLLLEANPGQHVSINLSGDAPVLTSQSKIVLFGLPLA